MNLKQKCYECGRELVKGQRTQKLMHGKNGFRRYDVWLRCAGVAEPSLRTVQKLAREKAPPRPSPNSTNLERENAQKDVYDARV